jgi:hypothetical protein
MNVPKMRFADQERACLFYLLKRLRFERFVFSIPDEKTGLKRQIPILSTQIPLFDQIGFWMLLAKAIKKPQMRLPQTVRPFFENWFVSL